MNEKELCELQAIKKLLILQLLNAGVSRDSIASLLEMDLADFSRMFPVRRILQKKRKK